MLPEGVAADGTGGKPFPQCAQNLQYSPAVLRRTARSDTSKATESPGGGRPGPTRFGQACPAKQPVPLFTEAPLNHRTRSLALALVLAAFPAFTLVAGCNKGDKPADAPKPVTGGVVGVVDYSKIFQGVGWSGKIEAALKVAQDDFTREFNGFRDELQRAVEAKKSQLAKDARINDPTLLAQLKEGKNLDKLPFTKDQLNELYGTMNNAGGYLQQAQQVANEYFQGRRNQIISAYRDALKPVVRRVGDAAGAQVVLELNPGIIFVTPSNDLTDKVIDEVQKSNVTASYPVETPKINFKNVDVSTPPPAATQPTATTKPAVR